MGPGLAYFGFKYSVCWNSQWLKLHLPNFHTFYTNSLLSKQPSFPLFQIVFQAGVDYIKYIPTRVSGGGQQDGGFNFKREWSKDALGQVMGNSGL